MTTPETVFADMGKILNARTNIDAYGIAGGFGTQFLTDWGTSVFRQTTFTPEWTMRSPATPPDFLALPPGDLGAISGHGEVSAPAYATSQYVVHTHADVVHVAIAGHAEIYSNGLEYSDLGDAYFCTREECSCPPGSTRDLPPLRPLFDQDYLGVTGDPGKGASGSIESMSLSDFCHPAPKPPPAVPEGGGLDCRSACGSSNGDPHLQTIAGRDYDFQARGEFTAVKSTTDDLEIQERQEPFKSPDVTVNSAVAMSVAGDRVEVDRGLVLRVNGTEGAPGALPHGGTVASEQGVITVTWPDGSQARLSTIGPWGVVYLFEPAPARGGQLVGLLGDSPQLVGRDGHVYASPYGRFGDSWRIAQAGSLFTYAPGKSTASYTYRRTPRPVKLPARTRAAAAAACASITNPLIRRDCVLDVGVTGERAFATAGAQLQRTAQAPPASAFEIVCDSAVPPDASGQVPVGTDVGIEVRLHGDGQVLIHWPQDGIVDQGDSDTSDFHELDDPGIHTAYATSGGAQSETCTWNVSG